ncbi:MAG: hypothetical protein OEN52_04755 [Gammaproteobacteria bacterium]|nr:hypothetical protein [Gammaproteobacteria bacterium]
MNMPDVHELGFGKIILIDEDIAEVIIDNGIEMDMGMVNEYHNFLLTHLKTPFSLLINKINSYSYTFAAQRKLATLPQIKAMAVVTYNPVAETTTRSLIGIPRDREWRINLFNDRERALQWLRDDGDRTDRDEMAATR